MGIDGWLYISVGDFGLKDSKGTDGTVLRFEGGGIARIRPDGSELEMFVFNTRNQFDVAISPTLEFLLEITPMMARAGTFAFIIKFPMLILVTQNFIKTSQMNILLHLVIMVVVQEWAFF